MLNKTQQLTHIAVRNSQVAKSSYEIELGKTTSQFITLVTNSKIFIEVLLSTY